MQRTGRQLALAFLLLLVAGAGWWIWRTFFWSPSLASYDDWIPAYATWTFEARKDDPTAEDAQRVMWASEQKRRFVGTALETASWRWSEGRFLAYGTTLNTAEAVYFFPIRDVDLYEEEMNPAFLSAAHDAFGGFSMFQIGDAWMAPLKDALVVASTKEALQEVILVRQKTSPRLSATRRLETVRSELRSYDWVFLFKVDAIESRTMLPTTILDRDRWAGVGVNRKPSQWNMALYLPTTITLEQEFAGALLRTIPSSVSMAIGAASIDTDGAIFSALGLWDPILDTTIAAMPSDLRSKAVEFISTSDPQTLRVRTPGNDVVTIEGTPVETSSAVLPSPLADDPILRQLPKDRLLGFVWMDGRQITKRVSPLLATLPFPDIIMGDLSFDRLAAVLQTRERGVTMHVVLTDVPVSSSSQTVAE